MKPSKIMYNLAQELDNAHVRYAHWKSNIHLRQALNGKTDADIFVHPKDRKKCLKILELLNFKQVISQTGHRYKNIEDWIGLDSDTGALLHVHLHFNLLTGVKYVKHLKLPWDDVFFQNIVRDKKYRWSIPKPELEIIILLVRIWAKMPFIERLKFRPHVPDHIYSEFLWLEKQIDVSEVANLCHKLNLNFPQDFEEKIKIIKQKRDDQELTQLAKFFYIQLNQWQTTNIVFAFIKSATYKTLVLLKKLSIRYVVPVHYKKTLVPKGLTVAIVGSDGAGKSSLIHDLYTWLVYKIDVHAIYMGAKPGYMCNGKNMKVYYPSFLLSCVKGLSKSCFYIISLKRKRSLSKKAVRLADEGSIVLFDRYPQHLVQNMNDGPRLQKIRTLFKVKNWEINSLKKIEEEGPNIVIKLSVSPEVAHARKPDHEFERLKEKIEAFHKITFKNSRVYEVDAHLPYDKVLLLVKKHIWKSL